MKLNKVIEIYEAVKLLESNTKLDFKISYRLGRIQDKCKSIIQTFESTQNKLREKYQKLLKDNPDKEQEFNQEFVKELNAILEIEETIEIPTFNLNDFENKEIPVKFFSAFTDYITE